MKKLYTLAALVALSASAAFAAAPEASIASAQHMSVELLPGQPAKRPTVSASKRGFIAQPVAATTRKAPTKRAAVAADTEWEYIGEAKYDEAFLFTVYGFDDVWETYEVKAYKSTTNDALYKLEDIYPASYLEEEGGYYIQTDGKTSSVILDCTDPTDVVADFDLHLTDVTDGTALTVEQIGTVTYAEGNFAFSAYAFYICYDGVPYAYSPAFSIALPGARDYSFSLASTSGICNPENLFSFSIEAGEDVPLKYFFSAGRYGANQNNFELIAGGYGESIEAGNHTIDLSDGEEGWYTLLVVSCDDDGTLMQGAARYFYVAPEFKAEDWVSLGKVDFTDDTYLPMLGIQDETKYQIELLQNLVDPTRICMVDPYGDTPYSDQYYNHDHQHNIYVDVNALDNVTIPLQPMGVYLNDVNDYAFGTNTGTKGAITNGVLKFPYHSLVLFQNNGSGYYANMNDSFALEVPDFLTVKVTVDGAPVENAFVNYADWSGEGVYTNAEGVAYMPVKPGSTEFMAYKDGYETTTFTADAQGRILSAEAELTPALASFSVWVRDAEEEPIAEAYVTFMEQEYFTNESGEVKVSGLNGPDVIGKTFPFTVYKDGYDPYEGTADFTETLDALRNITLVASTATLTVIVNGVDAEPVEGATVTFDGEEKVTGEDGKAVFTGIAGPDVIGKMVPYTVYKDGYDPYEGEADFTEGLEAMPIAQLTEAEATLTIMLFGVDDEPLADAWVWFLDFEAKTDANGNAEITGIPALSVLGKKVPYSAYKDGYEFYDGEVDFTETLDGYAFATLTEAMATLDVIVLNENDELVGNATVTFLDKEYTTDENGKLTIDNIPALSVIGTEVPVTVTAPEYKEWQGMANFTEGIEYTVIATLVASDGVAAIIRDIENGDTKVYDLNGRHVLNPANGHIYIVNGVKVRFNR